MSKQRISGCEEKLLVPENSTVTSRRGKREMCWYSVSPTKYPIQQFQLVRRNRIIAHWHFNGWSGAINRRDWLEPTLVGRGLLGRK